MKNFLLVLVFQLTYFTCFSQYSNFYKVDINNNSILKVSGEVRLNQNINLTGNVNKTITTIDYGALRLANVQSERNRLEMIKYNDEKSKIIALEIADDPSKSVDYGNKLEFNVDKKISQSLGIKRMYMRYNEINSTLFQKEGGTYVNYGDNNIRTEVGNLSIYPLTKEFFMVIQKESNVSDFSKMWYNFFLQLDKSNDLEETIKDIYLKEFASVGNINSKGYYVHFVEMSKSRVNGMEGFKVKVSLEDEYEMIIDNTFFSYDNIERILYVSDCLIKGNVHEVNFEQIEGKNEYFRKLFEKYVGQKRYHFLK